MISRLFERMTFMPVHFKFSYENMKVDNGLQIIMFVSAQPKEGKCIIYILQIKEDFDLKEKR